MHAFKVRRAALPPHQCGKARPYRDDSQETRRLRLHSRRSLGRVQSRSRKGTAFPHWCGGKAATACVRRTTPLLLDGAFRALGSHCHPACRFVGDDAQAVTAFPTESVHQAPRLFMGQSVGFAAAIAQHRPAWLFQVTRHRTKCGQRCPRSVSGL